MDLKINSAGNSAPLFDLEAHEKLRTQWANENRVSLPPGEYDCPVCKNKLYIPVYREKYPFATLPCKCVEIRKNWAHIRQSGMEELLQRHSFVGFRVTEPWQADMLRGAQAYAETPKGWIMFSGQSGCGKTHLCSAICRSLATQNLQFRYMPWREEITALKALATDHDRREKKMERLRSAPYLFIDDLFKGGQSSAGPDVTRADVSIAFELINYRYIKRLPTIISTELYPEELLKVDEALCGRILESCGKHLYTVKRVPGRNYRLKAAM